MNQTEIANVARAAGFPESAIAMAVAIAMAESSGNPRAYNGSGSDQSYGLWQINMRGALGPQRRAAFGLSSNEDLYDPATNARIAYALSGGGASWNPWGAYTNGSYRGFYSPSLATGGAPGGGSTAGVPDMSGLITNDDGSVNWPLVIGGALLLALLLR